MKSPTYGMDTKYTYKPPRYTETLNVHNEWIVEELNKPENSLWLEKTLIDRILALPRMSYVGFRRDYPLCHDNNS